MGKTWLVRDLAARSGRELAEVNFERDPSFARYRLLSLPPYLLRALANAVAAVTASR